MILCDAEPITRSEQFPCGLITAFSLTGLFLELFWGRIKNIFQVSQTSHQNLNL